MRGKRNLFQPGERFGKLTILRRWTDKLGTRSKESICECVCECGGVVTVPARYLRGGHKMSCGCLRHRDNKDHHGWKGHGEISGTAWGDIVSGCKRQGRVIPITVTIEEIWDLFLQQNRKCALSGVEIGFSKKAKRYESGSHTASLDRIDSSKGYEPGNVQWVHKSVQVMKWAYMQDDFIQWCKLIAGHNP